MATPYGDYSIFRVYTTPEVNPLKYTSDNIPMKAEMVLPVSLKGVKENDFSMIWGYPGSTNRYEGSYGIGLSIDINIPNAGETA